MTGLATKTQGAFIVSALVLGSIGCQSNAMTTMPWGQPTRVPPPNAPSNLPMAPYASPAGPASGAMQPGATGKPVAYYPNNPLTDAVASAQNELRMATDGARSAIEKSANSVNSTVSQASARLDRVGSGVVQATGILESSLKDPIPLPPPVTGFATPVGSPAPDFSGLPPTTAPVSSAQSGASGTIGDASKEDPNAQWRKPTPR